MSESADPMKRMNPSRTAMVVAWVATLSLIVALGARTADGQAPPRVPLAQDWSHRHLIYSAPATVEQALRLQNDPRYWHQWIQRHGAGAASIDAAARVLGDALLRRANNGHDTLPAGDTPAPMQPITSSPDEGVLPTLIPSAPDEGVFSIHRDWGTSLGAGGAVGAGMSPAKFSFDVNATPSCANDFVVFNTSVMSVATAASATGTFAGSPTSGQTVTITSGANSETLTATGAAATGTVTIVSGPNAGDTVKIGNTTYKLVPSLVNANDVLFVTGNTTKSATNLRAAIDASSGQCSASPAACYGTGTSPNALVTATNNTDVVTVTAIASGAAGNAIALTSSNGVRILVSGATLSGGVDAVNTGANFALGGTTSNIATNLAAAIIRNNNVGITATSIGSVVTVTATAVGTAGNGTTLAKSLSNFSWNGGSLSGGVDPQASIIAYNQLYSTQGSIGGFCTKNGPSVMWSYNTTAGGNSTGTTVSSPVLSLDGTKVAYVETNSIANGGAILHILKWKSGQGTAANAPVMPDQIVADWSSCTAGNSCIVNIPLNGGRPATISAPFYDYSGDALYVGDDSGVLHKLFPVLNGTPVEVTTGGWPITVNRGAVLAGPVFDAASGNIFVGDGSGTLSYVRETTSMVGTCSSGSPPCLGTPSQTAGGAGVDAPLVDSVTGMVFAFDGTDGGNGTVYQIDTALSNGSIAAASVGGRGGGSAMFAGAFDNAYMSSVNGTGHLFVCGKDPGQTDRPAIHRITITKGVMNNFSDGSLTLVSSDQVECSSVTEVYNTSAAPSTDWIFFSVGGSANQTPAGCSATAGITGCLMSLNLTALASWPPLKVTQGYRLPTAPPNQGSTSEIIIDNVANTTSFQQASSLYFSFLNNGVAGATCNGATGVGCAVKLTQSALQ